MSSYLKYPPLVLLTLFFLRSADAVQPRRNFQAYCSADLAALNHPVFNTEALDSAVAKEGKLYRYLAPDIREIPILYLENQSIDSQPIVRVPYRTELLVPNQGVAHFLDEVYVLEPGYYVLQDGAAIQAQSKELKDSFDHYFFNVHRSRAFNSSSYLVPLDQFIKMKQPKEPPRSSAAPVSKPVTVVTPRGTWYVPKPSGGFAIFERSSARPKYADLKLPSWASHYEILRSQGRAPEAAETMSEQELSKHAVATNPAWIERHFLSGEGDRAGLRSYLARRARNAVQYLNAPTDAARDSALMAALKDADDWDQHLPPPLRWRAPLDKEFLDSSGENGPTLAVHRRFIFFPPTQADGRLSDNNLSRLRLTPGAIHYEVAEAHLGELARTLHEQHQLRGGGLLYEYDTEGKLRAIQVLRSKEANGFIPLLTSRKDTELSENQMTEIERELNASLHSIRR